MFYKKRTNKVESIDQDRFFQNGPLLLNVHTVVYAQS